MNIPGQSAHLLRCEWDAQGGAGGSEVETMPCFHVPGCQLVTSVDSPRWARLDIDLRKTNQKKYQSLLSTCCILFSLCSGLWSDTPTQEGESGTAAGKVGSGKYLVGFEDFCLIQGLTCKLQNILKENVENIKVKT